MSNRPQEDWTAYGSIIVMSIVLCAAWLITGNVWLTLAVLVLELLRLARDFPAIDALVQQDPLLVWLRRAAPIIILVILGLGLALRTPLFSM